MGIDFGNEFSIAKHGPTDLTQRLLSVKPGDIVKFTLEELLQQVVVRRESNGERERTVLPGPMKIYQIAAQYSEPSVAAQVALVAIDTAKAGRISVARNA